MPASSVVVIGVCGLAALILCASFVVAFSAIEI
jgi:hypothetical protein